MIGKAPQQVRAKTYDFERMTAERKAGKGAATVADARGEPHGRAAGQPAVGHAPDRRHRRPARTPSNQGSKAVLVGIIDTGIDGTHPDIAPNFDAR